MEGRWDAKKFLLFVFLKNSCLLNLYYFQFHYRRSLLRHSRNQPTNHRYVSCSLEKILCIVLTIDMDCIGWLSTVLPVLGSLGIGVWLLFRKHEWKARAGSVADSYVSFLATRVPVAWKLLPFFTDNESLIQSPLYSLISNLVLHAAHLFWHTKQTSKRSLSASLRSSALKVSGL